MKTIVQYLSLLAALFIFSSFNTVYSTFPTSEKKTIFEHLQQDHYLSITIESDFRNYVSEKNSNEYQPAVLRVNKPAGEEEIWDIEIRARGNMRRKVCDNPPMKIRFSEQQLKERGLDKRSTLKTVIICRNSGSYEQMVLKEYITYRLYNIITDHSFKVQLAKIKFVDLSGESKEFDESFAFFIEHPKNIVERTEGKILEGQMVSSEVMNTDAGERFAMFQYMIGNTDWYYFNGHNVELCGLPGTADLIPLPYDFDYAGIVKTPYAVPLGSLGIPSVTERYYQGYCRSKEETMQTIELFQNKKTEIMNLVDEFPYFTKYSRRDVKKYLMSFFKTIEKPKSVKRRILKHCDLWPVP